MRGMKSTEIELSRAEDLVNDPSIVFEQKFDGTRGIAVVTPDGMKMLHGGGGTLGHTAATQWLPQIEKVLSRVVPDLPGSMLVLDGEITSKIR